MRIVCPFSGLFILQTLSARMWLFKQTSQHRKQSSQQRSLPATCGGRLATSTKLLILAAEETNRPFRLVWLQCIVHDHTVGMFSFYLAVHKRVGNAGHQRRRGHNRARQPSSFRHLVSSFDQPRANQPLHSPWSSTVLIPFPSAGVTACIFVVVDAPKRQAPKRFVVPSMHQDSDLEFISHPLGMINRPTVFLITNGASDQPMPTTQRDRNIVPWDEQHFRFNGYNARPFFSYFTCA